MIPRAYRTESPTTPVPCPILARVDALLPPIYQGGAPVLPNSMGSAGLSRDEQGRVAWDRVWTTFCDLALAGGPPHRGTLLLPVTPHEADGADDVAAELTRAISLATGLTTRPGSEPGWLAVGCESIAAVAWLQLAVVAENVSCRRRGQSLELPVSPRFRVEKEVKNVVCALAKACHYWGGHLTYEQQTNAATLAPWEPATPADSIADPRGVGEARLAVIDGLRAEDLPVVDAKVIGWVGLECDSEDQAGFRLRIVASSGVMCRREGAILYVPAGSHDDISQCQRVVAACAEAWGMNAAQVRRA